MFAKQGSRFGKEMELGVAVPHCISKAYDKIRSSTLAFTIKFSPESYNLQYPSRYLHLPENIYRARSADCYRQSHPKTHDSHTSLISTWPAPHAPSLQSSQSSSSSNKPFVSLEEWEFKAPLGDLENMSVAAVKAAIERPSLSFKVCLPHRTPLSVQ